MSHERAISSLLISFFITLKFFLFQLHRHRIRKEKDESKAFKLLKKAQEINPYKAMIYFTRAKFLKEQKKASKEMTNIMTGLLIAPGNCKGYQRLLELKKTNENIKNKKNLVTFSKRMRADIKSIEKKSSAVCRD